MELKSCFFFPHGSWPTGFFPSFWTDDEKESQGGGGPDDTRPKSTLFKLWKHFMAAQFMVCECTWVFFLHHVLGWAEAEGQKLGCGIGAYRSVPRYSNMQNQIPAWFKVPYKLIFLSRQY